MNCLDRTALIKYLRGKLQPEELLAASEHIFSCSQCRQSLKSLESYIPAAAYVRDAAFGVTECPEYEELSAYIDGVLSSGRLVGVETHVGQCDLCRSDIVTMRSLRARTELAEPIVARPVRFRRGFSLELFPAWQKAVTGAAVAALILAGVFFAARSPERMAVNPEKEKPSVAQTQKTPPVKEQTGGSKQSPDRIASIKGTGKDDGGRAVPGPVMEMTKPVGKPAGSDTAVKPPAVEERISLASLGVGKSLEARLERAIKQKLTSGAMEVDEPVRVALATYGVRGGSETSDLAPILVYPNRGVLKNSPTVLRWKPVDQAVSYKVTLSEKDGDTVVHQTVEQAEFTLPAPLERGKVYVWRVDSNFGPGGDWKLSRAVAFRIISADESAALRRAEAKFAGHPEILGAIYESLGLYENAVRQFEKYAAAQPSKHSGKMLREARAKLASLK